MTLPERFNGKVSPEPMSGCWLWTGTINSGGYGTFWMGSRCAKAHRIAYEAFVGAIEPGLDLDHQCHNRACVNPTHLRPATRRQNASNLRGKRDGAFSSRFTGVSWHVQNLKWQATIKLHGRKRHLGYFASEEDAATAYKVARHEFEVEVTQH